MKRGKLVVRLWPKTGGAIGGIVFMMLTYNTELRFAASFGISVGISLAWMALYYVLADRLV